MTRANAEAADQSPVCRQCGAPAERIDELGTG